MGLMKDILTFGAAGRIERRFENYKKLEDKYLALYKEMDDKRTEINNVLETLIKVKLESVKSLSKIKKLSKNLRIENRQIAYTAVAGEVRAINFKNVEDTISNGQAALNATGGISAGVGTAAGAWALVSTLGFASTGTAIGGITGVAATNATLAWFGGGALAAGGGGMAAGAAVIGGIVAIPALILTGVFSHVQANKKIKEMDDKTEEIKKEMKKIRDTMIQLNAIERQSLEKSKDLIQSLTIKQELYNNEFNRIYKEIYKTLLLSRFVKWFRKAILRKSYFSDADLERIAYIGSIATDLAILIDTKVFELPETTVLEEG